MTGRLHLVGPVQEHGFEQFRAVVAEGLSAVQKRLPCRYFYDTTGSELFERICRLPEYYLTRTEQSILEHHAGSIVQEAGNDLALVEFGSGSSCKTRIVMDALLQRQPWLHYTPIDISHEFLHRSAIVLLQEYSQVDVNAIAMEYSAAIDWLPEEERDRLFLFLGSNIGNFEYPEAVSFLASLAHRMRSGDRLLIGVDMSKDVALIEAAYNDAMGITAAFNRNLLLRINRDLGGCFNPDRFEHHAPFVPDFERIEMRLVSRIDQDVPVQALDRSFRFRAGEHVHTENSHKYSSSTFAALYRQAGFEKLAVWMDERAWFALFLLKPAGDRILHNGSKPGPTD